MKISRIRISNVMGIKEFACCPEQMNIISGGNAQGKTSILEAIEKALNNSVRRDKFIRTGEDEAVLNMEITDEDRKIEITRKIREEGSDYIKVLVNGIPEKKPEAYLKALARGFCFNPVDFLKLSSKEQAELLLSLMPIHVTHQQATEWFGEIPQGVNYNQHGLKVLDEILQKFYDTRTEVNRKVISAKEQADGYTVQLPAEYKADYWRTYSLQAQYAMIDSHKTVNNSIEKAKEFLEKTFPVQIQQLEELEKSSNERLIAEESSAISALDQEMTGYISSREKDIATLEQKIAVLKSEIAQADSIKTARHDKIKAEYRAKIVQNSEDVQKRIHDLKTKKADAENLLEKNCFVDVTEMVTEAQNAEKMKEFLVIADNLIQAKKRLDDLTMQSENLTLTIKDIREKPLELMQTVRMPVPGLGVSDGNLTIDGLPISNLSTSQQIKLAVKIAEETSGTLKIVCIDRFESLDDAEKKTLIDELMSAGFQTFVTEVTEGSLKLEVK